MELNITTLIMPGGLSMDKLVFLDPDDIKEIPFTTSKVIADSSGVGHKKVKLAITKNKMVIESFGLLDLYETESTGGRPEVIYKLNEEQATFLITLLKNTPKVIDFKRKLVKQFYIMQKELEKRIVTREIGKRAREALTNAIQSLPESPHKQMKYKHFTDLVYKIVFNKNAKQLRNEFGITEKDNLRDRFTSEENGRIEKLEQQIGAMLDLGYDYHTIKEALTKRYLLTA